MNEFRNNYLGFDVELKQVKFRDKFGEILLDKFEVVDTFDFWQTNKEYNSKEQALDYIGYLLNCKTKQECYFYRWCANMSLGRVV